MSSLDYCKVDADDFFFLQKTHMKIIWQVEHIYLLFQQLIFEHEISDIVLGAGIKQWAQKSWFHEAYVLGEGGR
jgi:hypothetical protein